MVTKYLPFFTRGIVGQGFKRGSSQLGIPTANYADGVVSQLPPEVQPGVYCGWAQISDGPVYKMVMSIGWNPYYKNMKKSMEVHILNKFEQDFYGSVMKVCVIEYLRPEKDFSSIDELINAIKTDIQIASRKLDEPESLKFKDNTFFIHPSKIEEDKL